MKMLLKTPTTRLSYYGRNLVIEQEGKAIIIERADIPELLAAGLYIAMAENVSQDEIADCCIRLDLHPPYMSPPPEEPSKKIEDFQVGNIVKTAAGRKYMIFNESMLRTAQDEKHEFVCEKAHEDGSLAYLCRSEWCRCHQ